MRVDPRLISVVWLSRGRRDTNLELIIAALTLPPDNFLNRLEKKNSHFALTIYAMKLFKAILPITMCKN